MLRGDTARTFVGYCISGALGVGVYLALLFGCTIARIPSLAAFTSSYVVAVTAQFLMNKYWNFRSFNRPIHVQATTFIVVTAVNYVLMIAVEEAAIHALGVSMLLAYLMSVPINVPVGYVANRYITFGAHAGKG